MAKKWNLVWMSHVVFAVQEARVFRFLLTELFQARLYYSFMEILRYTASTAFKEGLLYLQFST